MVILSIDYKKKCETMRSSTSILLFFDGEWYAYKHFIGGKNMILENIGRVFCI